MEGIGGAATLQFLEKVYPIWKPRPKNYQGRKAKGRCPW